MRQTFQKKVQKVQGKKLDGTRQLHWDPELIYLTLI